MTLTCPQVPVPALAPCAFEDQATCLAQEAHDLYLFLVACVHDTDLLVLIDAMSFHQSGVNTGMLPWRKAHCRLAAAHHVQLLNMLRL